VKEYVVKADGGLLWDITGIEDSDYWGVDHDASLLNCCSTVVLKKESRAAMASTSSSRMTLSQHAVDRLSKSGVPVTDDSYKYLYRRTPDGYGNVCFRRVIITLIIFVVACFWYHFKTI